MSTSWVKDLGTFLFDDTHIVLTKDQFLSLNRYESTVPTSPSPGRAYRRGQYVYFVVDDPDKPGWQIHVPREALFV